MYIATDPATFGEALASPLPPPVKRLLAEREDLVDLATFVVPACGDELADIEAAAGIALASSPIDRIRFGDPGFSPAFEWSLDHGGVFELPYITSDDGAGVLLLLLDDEGIDPTLLAMARRYAVKADPDGGGDLDPERPTEP
jgi:hypothetical protein